MSFDIERYLGFMEEQVIEVTNSTNKRFLNNLWHNITEGNPVRSGLSRFSWRMVSGEATSYMPHMPSGYQDGDGVVFRPPAKPKILRSGLNYNKVSMFNNQNYVTKLDESESRYYYQFIQNGIDKAILETEVG